jgi:hypothetical protein
MKYLDEIPTFPAESARLLESRYGIATAEAFYEHALHEPQGLVAALALKKKTDLDRLIKLVEGHLEPSFIRAARAPIVQHERGALDPHNPPQGR